MYLSYTINVRTDIEKSYTEKDKKGVTRYYIQANEYKEVVPLVTGIVTKLKSKYGSKWYEYTLHKYTKQSKKVFRKMFLATS